MAGLSGQLEDFSSLNQVTFPDLWQQEAVTALRDGKDVVVQAPTGSGKTFIFELWSKQGKNRGQAIYTVPTRALANDKLAEWRSRGWDVGIATGDLAENLDAPIVVATLETQKNRLIHGDGPSILVVDEYQLLGDPDRGLNYELALALAPPRTQLLLLSGSVANPQDVVRWLERLGREAVLVRHDDRAVPLEEVHAYQLNYNLPNDIRGYWPRFAAKALAEDLGPILIFAPQRRTAEQLAGEIARNLPNPNPLQLGADQKAVAGEKLGKLLKARVSYHHSGLSYAARAGVVEPLAKAGQLRVVVATMGLAAGINFSLRSVALAGDSYRRDAVEQPLGPDEILQMFGRAGRRGIDETGYILITPNEIRLREAFPAHLSRSRLVDWGTLLGLMAASVDHGWDPFSVAVRTQERLFTSKPIFLGVEEALKHPDVPCGLKTDAERARHVRRGRTEILNSRGEWEPMPKGEKRAVHEAWVIEDADGDRVGLSNETEHLEMGGSAESGGQLPMTGQGRMGGSDSAGQVPNGAERPSMHSALKDTGVLETVGVGELTAKSAFGKGAAVAEEGGVPDQRFIESLKAIVASEEGQGDAVDETECGYGRAITVGDLLPRRRIRLVKWVRRLTRWQGRVVPLSLWRRKFVPTLLARLRQREMPVLDGAIRNGRVVILVSLARLPVRVVMDGHGIPLWKPPTREVLQPDCAACSLVETCRGLSAATGVAMVWRRLGLVDETGVPSLQGRIVSFFAQNYGLAIAAGIEDGSYPVDELIHDLANLDAGFRFCGEENRWAGRLAIACQKVYGFQSIPGYLEHGIPPKYGAGASEVVAMMSRKPQSKHEWVSEWLGPGDIDRVFIEWRSLLRQISHAPALPHERWRALQELAKAKLNETESPTLTQLPPMEHYQTKRVSHRLLFRRF